MCQMRITSAYKKFDSNGKFLMQFGSMGDADGQFEGPAVGPVYVNSQGNIYASTFSAIAQKFTAKENSSLHTGAQAAKIVNSWALELERSIAMAICTLLTC